MITKDGYKRLLHFLIWCIIGVIVAIIGISNVFADEIDVGYITSKTSVSYDNTDAQAMVSLPVQTNVNRYLYSLLSINISNQNILADNIYVLELSTPNAKLQNINEVHIVDSSSNVCQFFGTSDFSIGYPKIYFKCNQATNSLTITLNNTNPSTLTYSITTSNNFQWNYSYLKYFTEDDDIDLGPIISNQTQNTQDIINNQNQNNQQQIESQMSCKNYGYNQTKNLGYLNDSGELITNSVNTYTSDYIRLNDNNKITLIRSMTSNYRICFYTDTQSYISCTNVKNMPINSLITIPNNAKFFRYSADKVSGNPIYEYCTNGNQAITDAVDNLNDSINNDNIDDSDIGNAFDDFNDFLDDNSTITQLITLPVTLYTAILNNLNGSCSPFNLGKLFGTDLILPCINISQYLGSSLWTMIDIIISGFAIYEISKKFIKVFNNLSSLREGDVIDD